MNSFCRATSVRTRGAQAVAIPDHEEEVKPAIITGGEIMELPLILIATAYSSHEHYLSVDCGLGECPTNPRPRCDPVKMQQLQVKIIIIFSITPQFPTGCLKLLLELLQMKNFFKILRIDARSWLMAVSHHLLSSFLTRYFSSSAP